MRQVIRVLKTPVTLLILLAILGYGAYWGYQQVSVDTKRGVTACVPTDVGSTLTPERVTVRVLNGGEAGGHAKRTREFLLAFGFRVIYYNNTDRSVQTTTILGNAADSPEVLLLQKMFDGAVTEGDGRADHVVDVIVPTKYQEIPNPPKPSIPVDGPVCLPPITAATPSATATESGTATPSATASKKK